MNTMRLWVILSLCLCFQAASADQQTQRTDSNADTATGAQSLHVIMQKNPGCGCCDIWADHLRKHGFTVDVTGNPRSYELKEKAGIPQSLYSCHTAEVGGYFIEGHVPAKDILALLRLKPGNVRGLTVPGMPLGSPGMEHPRPQSFDTIAVGTDGAAHVFASHEAGEDFSADSD
jgi:hypothetical protein